MKQNIKYIAGALFVGLSMVACSPEEFDGANENDKPSLENITVDVQVDQTTNTVTLASQHLSQAYPYWCIPSVRTDDGEADFYSTLEKTSKVFALSGDKKIIYRVGNRNGFSDRAIEQIVHIDNSLKNLEGVAKVLTSEEGKQWRVADEEDAHFGYGPKGGDGSGTWTTGDSKVDGLAFYDDFINLVTGTSAGNFEYNGSMSYNPGEDGEMQFGGNGGNDKKAVSKQESSYKIVVEGDDVLLKLAPNTNMPFIPSDAFLANPVFRIDAYSDELLVLVANDGDRAWRLVLTSLDFGGAEPGWNGFTSGINLLDGINGTPRFWFANSGWGEIDAPEHSGSLSEGFKFTMNSTGSEQWQAQLHIENTGVILSAEKTYDFSIVIISTAEEIQMVTVKPHPAGDDNTFFTADKFPVVKGTNVIALSDCIGFDGEIVLTFDFAGAPEGTTFTLQNAYVAEHDAANIVPFNYNDANNVWRTEVEMVNGFDMSFWWADAGWGQIDDPEFAYKEKKNGANLYTITAPAATALQWQAQNTFSTKIGATADDLVDFSCVIIPNCDLNGATVKLTQDDNDDNFFFAEQVNLKAGVPNVVKFTDKQLSAGEAADALKLIFDFGGNPEGAVINITDIVVIKK